MICPSCRSALAPRGNGLHCPRCAHTYPSHQGIPDLRLHGDSYLSLEEDRARADVVVAALERHDFPGLLNHYWSFSHETPPELRRRFVASAQRGAARARHWLEWLTREGVVSSTSRVLDVGSGTAAFLAAAAGRVGEIVGLDIALRWLHVGRRRLLDAGIAAPPLVCAEAEAIPFPDGHFDLVASAATLEFTRDPGRVLSECARVLRPGGVLFLNTVNRFSLAAEPHVGLWGVGFLPRAWQAPYVRARGRGDYGGVRLVSYGELKRLVDSRFGRRRFEPAHVPVEVAAQLPVWPRLAVGAYRRLRRMALLRGLLRWIGPEWDVLLTRD